MRELLVQDEVQVHCVHQVGGGRVVLAELGGRVVLGQALRYLDL